MLLLEKKEILMILKNNWLLYGALFLCLPSFISANITTLQSWDPAPVFNAANLNMPPDTPFCNLSKRRVFDEDDSKHRRWGINISPFVQKATRAQRSDDLYFGDTPILGVSTQGVAGQQMSDYQGTPYLMGLFLGQDVNGNSIWGGSTSTDTGVITDISTATVAATELPLNLKNAVNALNDNANTNTSALIYNLTLGTAPNYAPSILSQSVLELDPIYFGAFTQLLAYQKAGFRWELNFDVSDDIGAIVRGGFCQITQRAGGAQSLSAQSTLGGKKSPIYQYLNIPSTSTTQVSSDLAPPIFNEWVSNNIDDLLAPTNGVDYNIATFSETGIEDIQFLGFVRHPFILHPVDTEKHTSIILTPYLILGCTAPIAPVKDYSKLYALPFGNNGHASFGGVVGLMFEFAKAIELGFEFGATGFFENRIDALPCPNHELQRVLYPYRQNVNYSPGFNGQFAAILNAYNFTHNISFSLKYNFVQHNQDTITLITPSAYFLPEKLEQLSIWNSQMITGALTFEIQPSIYVSFAWQGALTQKNAYCSNTVLTTLSFLF